MRREDRNLMIENIHIYQFYYDRLINMALAQFEWNNLPESSYRLELERSLLFKGTACMCKPKGLDDTYLTISYVFQGRPNIYGLPTKITGIGRNGDQVATDDWVVLFDNMTQTSLVSYIDLFAKMLWECHNTFRSNLRQQNTPYIVATNKNEALSFRNIFNHIFNFDPVVTVKNNADIDSSVKILDLKKEYIGGSLLEALTYIWNMAMAMFGITGETTKKERLLSDELVLNRQEDAIAMSARLLNRVEFCNKINKKYGLNVSVNMVNLDTTFKPYEPIELGKDDENNG